MLKNGTKITQVISPFFFILFFYTPHNNSNNAYNAYGMVWRTAARLRGRGWARLSVSAPVPRRPQQGRGERGLRVPAQMSSIHFPTSAYGGPLSSATEAEVMQFVGMSCHFTNCPSHWGPGQQKTSKGSLLFHPIHTITSNGSNRSHTPIHYKAICSKDFDVEKNK